MDLFRRTGETVSGVAGGIFSSAKDIAEQTKRGWENTTDQIETPEWIQKILRIHEEISGGGDSGGSKGPGGDPKEARVAAAAAVGTAAAYGYDQSPEEDNRSGEETARDDQMMVLTKKMIEIRSILQTVGQSITHILPSIVVIGSQSS